jgi:hypothetical protein
MAIFFDGGLTAASGGAAAFMFAFAFKVPQDGVVGSCRHYVIIAKK